LTQTPVPEKCAVIVNCIFIHIIAFISIAVVIVAVIDSHNINIIIIIVGVIAIKSRKRAAIIFAIGKVFESLGSSPLDSH
jgi:hypothetical protein